MERNIALKLMYVGTAYHGWQVQKNAVTVAETLERALSTVVCHPVKCTGAGRTDAGVHAQVYVANFRTTSTIPCDRLPLAVNTRLPDDIVVVRAVQVPMEFNAIGSCRKKEYTYRIYNSRLGNAFYVDRAWFYPKHLDESVMQRAASQFVGTHDFRAVRSVGTETRTTVRTVHYFQVERKGELIECRVCADGFLYNMVRIIAGTLVKIGMGVYPPEKMEELLNTHPGSASVMGLLFDTEHRVQLVMDRDVYDAEYFCCHPCDNHGSLKIKTSDLLTKFLPHVGHEPIVVDLPRD